MLERKYIMNYYLPYSNFPAMATNTAQTGILSRIFKNGINWSTILTNAQKTLNIVNQTIPVIKQMRPVVNNAKTMFKIMNEFKKVDTPQPNKNQQYNKEKIIEKKETDNQIQTTKINNDNPTFFL